MSAPPAAMLANVDATVRTSLEVLDHLEQSLRRAGFETGIGPYQKLSETLIGQRMWSRESAGPEIERGFRNLARKARAIFAMLDPYAEIMKRLAILCEPADGLSPDGDARVAAQAGKKAKERKKESASAPVDADPALAALAKGELSFTALRDRLKTDRRDLAGRLLALENAGAIASRLAGGRRLYRIKG
jgi:DNA-binding transcriptional ArsR family regulator